MVHARRVDGLADVHAELGRREDDVKTVLMIVRPPGDPVISTTLPVLGHDRRRHRAEHPLAGVDQVGGRADVAVGSVTPGFLLKSPISLFSRKPAPLTTTREP